MLRKAIFLMPKFNFLNERKPFRAPRQKHSIQKTMAIISFLISELFIGSFVLSCSQKSFYEEKSNLKINVPSG